MEKNSKIPALDLHGVAHEDVESLCHEFVNFHWGSDRELHIITGHSVKMTNLVSRVLKLYDVEIILGDPRNCGYLRVLT